MEVNERKRGAVLSYVSIMINTIVQLLYMPFMIRMLGQSEYGLYSLVSSIIGYLTVFDLGFGNALVIYTLKYRAQKQFDKEEKLHGMFFIIFCIIGLIVSILGLLLFFATPYIFASTMSAAEIAKIKIMMLILTFNLAISFPFSIYSSIITAYEKFTWQKIISIISTLIKPIIMIPFLFLGYKSITMVLVITFVNIIILFSNKIYCKNKLHVRVQYNGFDLEIFKTIFKYSIYIFISVIVDKINWSTDNFLLGIFSGTAAVSIYSIASQINQLYISFSTAISGTLLPKITKMVEANASTKELTVLWTKTGRIQLMVIGLILSGFTIFGKCFVNIWAGPDYQDSYIIALILMFPMIASLTQNSAASIIQAKNKHKFMAIVTALASIMNIIISIPLTKLYGGIGAAIGTAIALIIANIIIKNIYFHRVIKLDVIYFFKNMATILLAIVLYALIWKFISSLFVIGNLITLVIFCALYSIFYCLLMLLVMNDYEKGLIKFLIQKLNRKKK